MPTLWSERIFFEKTIYILKFFWKYTYLFLYQNVFDFLRILSWRLFIIIIKTFSSIRILQIIVNWGLVIITSLHDFICVISGRMVEGLTILDSVVGLYMIKKIVIIRNFMNKLTSRNLMKNIYFLDVAVSYTLFLCDIVISWAYVSWFMIHYAWLRGLVKVVGSSVLIISHVYAISASSCLYALVTHWCLYW